MRWYLIVVLIDIFDALDLSALVMLHLIDLNIIPTVLFMGNQVVEVQMEAVL